MIKRLVLIGLVIAVLYGVIRYRDVAQNSFTAFVPFAPTNVLGLSTKKANEVTGKLQSDIGDGVKQAKKQALQISLGDVINGFTRLQRIPQDANTLKAYVQDHIEHVIESRK